MPPPISFNRLKDIFARYNSMDLAQEAIDNALYALSTEEKGAVWLAIFNYSNQLGEESIPPQVRGRAGEMLCKCIIESMISYKWLGDNATLYHSLHVRGTEQDLFLLTNKGCFLLEVKSQLSKEDGKMEATIAKGESQHNMHLERLNEFITKDLKFKNDIVGKMYLVYIKSGEVISSPNSNDTRLAVQDLCKQIHMDYDSWESEIKEFGKLKKSLDDYYTSNRHKEEEAKHKERLGYK